jgi:hypothetical protein
MQPKGLPTLGRFDDEFPRLIASGDRLGTFSTQAVKSKSILQRCIYPCLLVWTDYYQTTRYCCSLPQYLSTNQRREGSLHGPIGPLQISSDAPRFVNSSGHTVIRLHMHCTTMRLNAPCHHLSDSHDSWWHTRIA